MNEGGNNLTVREEVEQKLKSMSCDKMRLVCNKISGLKFRIAKNESPEEVLNRHISGILKYHDNNNHFMWNRVCSHLDIRTREDRSELHSAETVNLARVSNQIAAKANNKATNANYIALGAAVVSALAIINPPFLSWFAYDRETPTERVYRVCGDCGLTRSEVDELIDDAPKSLLTPAGLIQLWKDTAKPEAVELCRDYVDAVVEAVSG